MLFAVPRVMMVRPMGVGKLNGWPVKVLRVTGCTGIIVDSALVPDVMVIPGS